MPVVRFIRDGVEYTESGAVRHTAGEEVDFSPAEVSRWVRRGHIEVIDAPKKRGRPRKVDASDPHS